MRNRYEASSYEGGDAKITIETRRFDGLPAMVRIKSDGKEYVATLAIVDVDDVFGIGRSTTEAVNDLVDTLHETRQHLEQNPVPLSARLRRQLSALNALAKDGAVMLKADTDVHRMSNPRREGTNVGRSTTFRWAAASNL